jgi:hypothetical protein
VSAWSDTLESKRKAKLKWKQETKDREEERRKKIDQEEAGRRELEIKTTIDRAKQLQYEEKEKVRFLRSQQLYTEVIATREEQIKETKARHQKWSEEEQRWHEHNLLMFKEAEDKNNEKVLRKKEHSLENSTMMTEQIRESEERRQQILNKQQKEESEFIKKIIDVENENERRIRDKKRDTRLNCREELEQIDIDHQQKEEARQRSELKDLKKREADIARMEFVANARLELEKKHFNERQNMRKILSDTASKALEARAAREVEIFIRDQKAQEAKEEARKEEEVRLKKERELIVHESRQKQIEELKNKRLTEIVQDKMFANLYETMGKAALEKEVNEANDRRQKELSIRKYQAKQIAVGHERRVKEKHEHLMKEEKVRLTNSYLSVLSSSNFA